MALVIDFKSAESFKVYSRKSHFCGIFERKQCLRFVPEVLNISQFVCTAVDNSGSLIGHETYFGKLGSTTGAESESTAVLNGDKTIFSFACADVIHTADGERTAFCDGNERFVVHPGGIDGAFHDLACLFGLSGGESLAVIQSQSGVVTGEHGLRR